MRRITHQFVKCIKLSKQTGEFGKPHFPLCRHANTISVVIKPARHHRKRVGMCNYVKYCIDVGFIYGICLYLLGKRNLADGGTNHPAYKIPRKGSFLVNLLQQPHTFHTHRLAVKIRFRCIFLRHGPWRRFMQEKATLNNVRVLDIRKSDELLACVGLQPVVRIEEEAPFARGGGNCLLPRYDSAGVGN